MYILRCGDGSLYTGVTTDVAKRVAAHAAGRGARYTRGRGPFAIVRVEEHAGHGAALRRELELKRLARNEKLRLIGRKGLRAARRA